MKHLAFWFDVISPCAYLAFERPPQALAGLPVVIDYRPVLFAGLLNHRGQKGPAEIEPKRAWTFRHVAWLAHRHGVTLQTPAPSRRRRKRWNSRPRLRRRTPRWDSSATARASTFSQKARSSGRSSSIPATPWLTCGAASCRLHRGATAKRPRTCSMRSGSTRCRRSSTPTSASTRCVPAMRRKQRPASGRRWRSPPDSRFRIPGWRACTPRAARPKSRCAGSTRRSPARRRGRSISRADEVRAYGIASVDALYWVASAHAVMGDRGPALDRLEEAVTRGQRHAWWARHDWNWTDLAGDSRFRDLLARGGPST